MKEKILVGFSGGTDSAYSVELLRNMGYEPVGAFLKMHAYCAVDEARAAAGKMKLELIEPDVSGLFQRTVVQNFIDEYNAGRTPNPCAFCNPNAKFFSLLKTADELGIEKIATGHYSRLSFNEKSGRYEILKAFCERKDQSYVLWGLSQKQLSRVVFPMGEKDKSEAAEFVISEKILDRVEESQEICFIPDNDYRSFLKRNSDSAAAFREGDFVDSEGRVLGRHKGIAFYTVGQRKGLNIALGRPAYVQKIDAKSNRIILGFAQEGVQQPLHVSSINFVSSEPFCEKRAFSVKVRYKASPVPAEVSVSGTRAEVEFSTRPSYPTPGQSAVFYEGEKLSFGGIIE